jgi:FMN-dependent NADH-azoreductase
MSELLILKSSPRGEDSATGKLAEAFVQKWKASNPQAVVNVRDVGPGKVQGPDQAWIEANLTPEAERTPQQRESLAQSDAFIEELKRASHVLITAPMYNFSVPWNLKAYIDNIVREGETFFFSPETGHGPLLPAGKKLLLMWTAAGDYAPGSEMAAFDFLSEYVRAVFIFIGITDYTVISAGNRAEAPALAEASLKASHEHIDALSPVW